MALVFCGLFGSIDFGGHCDSIYFIGVHMSKDKKIIQKAMDTLHIHEYSCLALRRSGANPALLAQYIDLFANQYDSLAVYPIHFNHEGIDPYILRLCMLTLFKEVVK